MIYIGFSKYVPGRDSLGDSIERHASRLLPDEREKYPYPHSFLVCGDPSIGYHRSEVFTNGLSYVWYPPGGVDFQEGLYFTLDSPIRELQAMYRILDPWTRNYAHCSKKHIIKVMRGEMRVMPDFTRGSFTCQTFVLWALGMLDLPHRHPQLIEWFRANNDLFGEYHGTSEKEGIRWSPEN
jgi:hypothetical protein